MKSISKVLNYIFIIVGAIIAIYAQAEEQQNTIVLVSGIVVLMIGIYRISKTIGDKPKGPEGFVRTDKEDEEQL